MTGLRKNDWWVWELYRAMRYHINDRLEDDGYEGRNLGLFLEEAFRENA